MPASKTFWSVWKFLLFIYLFFLLVSRFTCVRLLPFTPCYEYFMLPLNFRNKLNRLLFPLSDAHKESNLKISGVMTFRSFTKGSLNGLLLCSLWQMASTIPKWGLPIIYLNNKCTKNVQLHQDMYSFLLDYRLFALTYFWLPTCYISASVASL